MAGVTGECDVLIVGGSLVGLSAAAFLGWHGIHADVIEKHAGTGSLVLPHHFATPTSGRIERAGDAFRFDFVEGS